MTAALTTYAVDLNALRSAVGAGDAALEARVRRSNLGPKDRRRVQDLLYLGPRAMSWSDGGYALEALCRALGRELPSDATGRLGYEAAPRLAELDGLLSDLGMTLSWGALYATSGPPVPLGGEAGWPHIFHLEAEAIQTLYPALRAALSPCAGSDRLKRILALAQRDNAPREVVNGLQRWLAAWPLFGSVRKAAASVIREADAHDGIPPERWEELTRSFAGLEVLNWRAAALLEETAGWLRDALKDGFGLVGFEY